MWREGLFPYQGDEGTKIGVKNNSSRLGSYEDISQDQVMCCAVESAQVPTDIVCGEKKGETKLVAHRNHIQSRSQLNEEQSTGCFSLRSYSNL